MFHSIIFNFGSNGNPGARTSGAHRIATWLREHNWDVEVIDFFSDWTFEELKHLLKSRVTKNTKFVGFSRLFFNDESNIPEVFLQYLKHTYPDIKIIIGGPERDLYTSKLVDAVISGYAEHAILELLKYFFSNGKRLKYSLLSPIGKHIDANKMYPSFPMKNLMIKYEDRDFIHPYEWLGVEISRGCMFQCDFCNYPILGVKGDYTRDGDDFRIQLQDAYDRFGVDKYLISDETFNDRTEKITKFADEVEKLSFDPFFWAFIRADLLATRKKDREELLRMNVLAHLYGIETFNAKSGKSIKKGMNPEKLKNELIEIKNYFTTHGSKRYRGTIALIIGLPYETKQSLEETKLWLINNWQTQAFSQSAFRLYNYTGANESLIMKDKEFYGYREVSSLPIYEDSSKSKSLRSTINWENDYMTFFEAKEISNNFFNNVHHNHNYDFRMPSWALHYLYSKEPNLQKRDVEFDDVQNYNKLIYNYKQKKLSL